MPFRPGWHGIALFLARIFPNHPCPDTCMVEFLALFFSAIVIVHKLHGNETTLRILSINLSLVSLLLLLLLHLWLRLPCCLLLDADDQTTAEEVHFRRFIPWECFLDLVDAK
jgi:hypothetical protein